MLQSLPHFLLYNNCYILIRAQYDHKSRVTAYTTFLPNFSIFLFETCGQTPHETWNMNTTFTRKETKGEKWKH